MGHPEAAGRLAACLAEEASWPDVVAEVRRLRVAPLFHAGLQAAMLPSAPDALRHTVLAAGARSVRLEQAAAAAISAASEQGIPVLLLKGLALQILTYPAGIVRQMDDIDLLVSPSDAPRLGEVLRDHGYRNDLRGEEDFFSPDLSHSIDLHTDLVNATRLPARRGVWAEPFERVWRRRQPLSIGGVGAWSLGPQDCLRHLAVHAVHHHSLRGVVWMADLLAALRRWPTATRALGDGPAGVRRSVWYCLEALAARGQDPIPEVRTALKPGCLLPGERRMLSTAGNAHHSIHIRYAFTLACLSGFATKAAFLRQVLFPGDAVYGAGFSDAGPTVRGTWPAHWAHLARLLTHRGVRGGLE